MKKSVLLLLAIKILASENININNGKDDAVNTLNYFKNDFTSNISNPLTTDTDFKTQSGKTFKANITCNEDAKKFITITYSGNSDININVQIDKNLNASFSSYNITGVSGICSNGFIKCNLDSWNGCKYYQYTYNNALSINEVSFNQLSGCSCINSSCNNSSQHYKKSILGDIGGTLLNLFSNYYNDYDVSLSVHNSSKIEYLAKKHGSCINNQGEKGIGYTQTDDNTMLAKTEELKASQSGDENSTYSIVTNSVNNQNNHSYSSELDDLKEVQKNISIDGDENDYSYSYSAKTKGGDGSWYVKNDDSSMQIDFTNTDSKYCEVKYLKTNSQVHTDETQHTTQNNEDNMWHTDIRECTGTNKDICPYDVSAGEMIKHPCGQIDNFAEATSQLQALQDMADDISCSQ